MASAVKLMAGLALSAFLAGGAVAQSVGESVEAGGYALEALPTQTLKPGQCALFVWSRSERPVFMLYVPDNPARATAKIGGRMRQIDRKTVSGERVLGHYAKQNFSDGRYAFELELAYDGERSIQQGAIIRQGVLRSSDSKGAVTIVPVGGMIGCKPA